MVSDDNDRLWVALKGANLCLDCESIFRGYQCPACLSRNVMPIEHWVRSVDGDEEESIKIPEAPATLPVRQPERWRQAAYGLLGLAAGLLIGRNRPN